MRSRQALLALAATALATAMPAAVAVAAPTGSIAGTVTAAGSHLPLAGVRVCAVSEDFEEEVEEFCTHSAGNGSYTIALLPEERYRVEFLAAAESLNYQYQVWNHKPDPFDATLVQVTTAEVPGIDAELEEGGQLGGRVTSFPSGAPIAGVEVCAEPQSLEAVEGCAITDAAGQYLILGLSASGYRVEFAPPEQLEFLGQFFNGEPSGLQADPVAVAIGQLTPNVDATLLEGGRIGGTVTDALTHLPLAGVSACTFTTLGRETIGECGSSGADGRYLIRKVPAGVYTVRFFAGEAVPGRYRDGEYTGSCGNIPVAVTVAAGALTAGVDTGLFPATWLGAGKVECVAPPSPAAQKPKPKACRKGTRRKFVKGKRRCVKIHKHHRRHRHPHRAG